MRPSGSSGGRCHPDKLLSVEAEPSNWDWGASWWSSFHLLRTTFTIDAVGMGAVITEVTWPTDKLLSVAVKQCILLPFSSLANWKRISFQDVICGIFTKPPFSDIISLAAWCSAFFTMPISLGQDNCLETQILSRTVFSFSLPIKVVIYNGRGDHLEGILLTLTSARTLATPKCTIHLELVIMYVYLALKKISNVQWVTYCLKVHMKVGGATYDNVEKP